MSDQSVYILWDESHLWGIMAWRAMRAMGINCRLVKSIEITQAGCLGKGSLLVAPGGSARAKAKALGPGGMRVLRQWVSAGGHYLGFCGGAGFALTQKGDFGLGICPWRREPYQERIQHLLSGNVLAKVDGKIAPLPIWWPGRFAPEEGRGVTVLATYASPGKDLWLADLPLASISGELREKLRNEGKIDLYANFPQDQPLIIKGKRGAGQYVLSYAHLETPDSPAANALFADMLEEFFGIRAQASHIAPWLLQGPKTIEFSEGDEPGAKNTPNQFVELAGRRMGKIMALGEKLGLFFPRSPWLMGWRNGLQGIACNNLRAAIAALAELPPIWEATPFWAARSNRFAMLFDNFMARCEALFWNMALNRTLNIQKKSRDQLEAEQTRLFGHPMFGGGMIEDILNVFEELIFLSQAGEENGF